MEKKQQIRNNTAEFLIFAMQGDAEGIDVRLENDTVWLTQKAMADLYGVQVPAVSKHLKNVYDEAELSRDTTISKMETVINRGFRGEVSQLVESFWDSLHPSIFSLAERAPAS